MSATDAQEIEGALSHFDALDLAYFPAKGPAHYTLVTNNANGTQFLLTFADRRFAHEAPTVGRSHALIYTVARYHGKLAACGGAKPRTIAVAGKHVYWNGSTAWLCLKTSKGTLIRVSAYGPFLNGQQLGLVIATTKPGPPQQ